MKLIYEGYHGIRIECDNKHHISFKGNKQLFKWDCVCGKEIVPINGNSNLPADSELHKSITNYTGG